MISFIVPAYNEESVLEATLRGLHAAARAAGEPYEVIVVDDASSDRTSIVAASLGARVVRVAYRQIAATRNAGARQARGSIFMFVDADTLIDEAVVRAAALALRGGAAGGSAVFRYDGPIPLYARWMMAPSIWLLRVARLGVGCFFFCSRHAFETAGGFDEALYGAEDLALSRTLKRFGRFVVLHQAVVTSGRKLRAHSGRDALRLLGEMALHPRRSMRTRSGPLAIWYDGRREDPDTPSRGSE